MASIASYIADIEARIAKNRQYIETTLANARNAGRSTLNKSEDTEVERRFGLIDADKKALERARAIQVEEAEMDRAMSERHPTSASRSKPRL